MNAMQAEISPDLIYRMSAPVPRYTSYPTAPNFKPDIGPLQFGNSLAQLSPSRALSLYVHIPFCQELCWYCGCSTKAVRNRETISNYLKHLKTEILMVAGLLQGPRRISHIHWGGGSPNSLTAHEITELADTLRSAFNITSDTEFAVEIDPRWLTKEQVAAFARAGVNRASLGVQDFNPVVQDAINRQQSFETTQQCVEDLRSAGISKINIDLVYGLPHQTVESVAQTIADVISLNPDRIAIFGYAHLPARAKHQRMIDDSALPDPLQRFAQSRKAQEMFLAAGYVAVGIDHFARPDDPLAAKDIRRNFQGYTSDTADALIGFGASSISQLPDGYFQNTVPRQDYERRTDDIGLATVRGRLLNDDDRMRAAVIERLMCTFDFSKSWVRKTYGKRADRLLDEAAEVVATDTDGLVAATADGFEVTARGQPFVRSIAARFDAYFNPQVTRYSAGI